MHTLAKQKSYVTSGSMILYCKILYKMNFFGVFCEQIAALIQNLTWIIPKW